MVAKTQRIELMMPLAMLRGTACHQWDRRLATSLFPSNRGVFSEASAFSLKASWSPDVMSRCIYVFSESLSCWSEGLSSSSSEACPSAIELMLPEREAGEVAGDGAGETRAVMMLREFISWEAGHGQGDGICVPRRSRCSGSQ